MHGFSPRQLLVAGFLFSAAMPCCAHSLVVREGTAATAAVAVFVESEVIRVEIVATVPDLLPFIDAFPEEFRARMGLQSEPEALRHMRFFTDNFVIRADGRPLTGRVESFETRFLGVRDEITGASVPLKKGTMPITIPVVVLDLRYELESRPETLTITPPTAEGRGVSSSIGIVTAHLGQPMADFHPFSDDEVLDLDWEEPWKSATRNQRLRGRSRSPLGVFLHVEPTEVRIEVVARLVDLQLVADFGVGSLETIPVDLQDAVKKVAAELLAGSFGLTVNHERVTPACKGIRFFERSLRVPSAMEPVVDVRTDAAVVKAVFAHRVTGTPANVGLNWDLFSEHIAGVDAAIVDLTGSQLVELDSDHRSLNWQNTLDDPWIPALVDVPAPASPELNRLMWLSWIVLAAAVIWLLRAGPRAAGGGGPWWVAAVLVLVVVGLSIGSWTTTRTVLVGQDRATKIITALLHNVYHAFDFRDEMETRRILEQSVTAGAVESCLEIGKWLEVRDRTDMRAGVRRVELVDLTMSRAADVVDAQCVWIVTAAVGHLDHRHLETTRVVAGLRIEPVEGVWKITAFEPAQDSRS